MVQLIRNVDIDQRTLRRIYRDPTQEIPTAILAKLATPLGVSPADLLEVVDEDYNLVQEEVSPLYHSPFCDFSDIVLKSPCQGDDQD